MQKDLIRRNFSKYAGSYDKYASIQRIAAKKLIAQILMPKNSNLNILELGCGTGIYTEVLIDKFPLSKIDALDISSAMIETAKKKLNNKADFIFADGEEYEPNKRYDLITSNASMQWFNNLKSTLTKYKNMLNCNGRIIFSIFGPKTFFELAYAIKKTMNKNASIISENFIQKDTLFKSGLKLFNRFALREEMITEINLSLKDLLLKIKYTGTSGGFSKGSLFGKKTLDRIENIYMEKFGSIKASYQIFFCEAHL